MQILVMGYQEIKLEWPEVPRIKLKLLFICHLIFISWSSLGKQTRDFDIDALMPSSKILSLEIRVTCCRELG